MTTSPFGRPLTRADLEDLPDDGHRYELIDGSLIVSPHRGTVTRRSWATSTCCCEAGRAGCFDVSAPFPVRLAPGGWRD